MFSQANIDGTIFASLLRNHLGVSNLRVLLVPHWMGCLCRRNPFIFQGRVRRRVAKFLGSFSIDDDDGNGSENVGFKMNSRFFNLCRVYSNLLRMSNLCDFPWS